MPLKRFLQQKLFSDLPPMLRISRFRLPAGRQGGETIPVQSHPGPRRFKKKLDIMDSCDIKDFW